MKRFVFALVALMIGAAMAIGDAEASKRLGSGKNAGAQRQATPPAAAPAAPSAANPAAAAQKPGMGRWLGPLAGLAAGLGLAYLFGDQLGSIMMGLLVVFAVVIAVMFLLRRFGKGAGPQPAGAAAGAGNAGNTQFTGMPNAPQGGTRAPLSANAASPSTAAAAPTVPANFDADQFIHTAKQAFVSLQAANDRGDLEALREMTSDEMFASIKKDYEGRGGVTQQVEVVTLNAELLQVVAEGGTNWASVRFTGALRDAPGSLPEKFEEIWNLHKPTDGSGGWVLAGIQQPS
jgi:predicted lipid-binding transport protein (Tim44 family)